MDSLKNPWIPCPKTTMVEEEERHEKFLDNIPVNSVDINFESTNYKNDQAHLLVNLRKIIYFKRNLKFSEFCFLLKFKISLIKK